MKKLVLIATVMALSLSASFAGNGDEHKIDGRDVQVSIVGKQSHNLVYFKLLMMNESSDGIYSMVKKYDDGTFVSVATRNFYANCIDVPLLYSFVDNELPEKDVTYVLYRISNGTEVVHSWRYCAETKTLCETPNNCLTQVTMFVR